MLILSRTEVESLLDLDRLVDALAVAMVDLSRSRASAPPRVAASVADRDALLAAMPASNTSMAAMARETGAASTAAGSGRISRRCHRVARPSAAHAPTMSTARGVGSSAISVNSPIRSDSVASIRPPARTSGSAWVPRMRGSR
jgi:hypothetical protein